MKENISIIIPTFNNFQYLQPCLTSLIRHRPSENPYHIYVINNGHPNSCDWINSPYITVINAGENLGWEGGLKLGLQQSDSEFIVFLNDDTFIPTYSRLWLNHAIQHFRNPEVGAVGPSSNVVMGKQSIFSMEKYEIFRAKFLIGFCFIVRRSALMEVGGVDDSLPGGDDLDMSIRLRDAGYYLLVDKNLFVYHHGFKTGERVHGGSDKSFGWNSYEFKERTDTALIKKHGFAKWCDVMSGIYEYEAEPEPFHWEDREGEVIRSYIEGVTLDLGCGGNKTREDVTGVDFIPKGEPIGTLSHGTVSQADVTADVSKYLPFEDEHADTVIARHILEHTQDPIHALGEWTRVLKKGGRMIVAVPNQDMINSIPMNPEHVHSWNPQAMASLFRVVGLEVIEQLDPQNAVSFITIGEKK